MAPRSRTFTAGAALLGAVLVGAGAGAGTYAAFSSSSSKTVVRQVTVSDSQPAAAGTTLSVGQIYNQVNKGVVEVTVTSTDQATPFGGEGQSQQAQGSGFVYDDNGHIITNEHVVDGAQSISVKLWNGATYKATLVGSDSSTDLAVIKVDAPSSVLHPLTLGDSSKVAVGDGVVAIGSPFGLEETVTSGIVSALHRSMDAPNGFTINDSIQTDAAINHGNSGGPLLDMHGRVIGVNSQIESDSGGSDGVGFAIPSNIVRSIASQLISSGNVQHAYLGVAVQATSNGVRIVQVRSGTPAQRAGLRVGDVVVRIDGKKVSTTAELQSAIDARQPGDTVTITYRRNGNTHTAKVTLANRPS
jgi:putative serine protease PepD